MKMLVLLAFEAAAGAYLYWKYGRHLRGSLSEM